MICDRVAKEKAPSPMATRSDRRAAGRLLWQQGERNASDAARRTGDPVSTMKRYFAKLARGESLDERPRSGRPLTMTHALRRELGAIKMRIPWANASLVAAQLHEDRGIRVSKELARQALRQLGYTYRKPRRQRLTAAQRAARLAFATAHAGDAWDRRWSVDECTFNLWREGNRYWIRVREVDGEDEPSLPRLTEGQESVSVSIVVAIWRGRKSAIGFLPRNWTAEQWVEVFDRDVFPSLAWSNRRLLENELIADNDGRHQTRAWRDYAERRQLRPVRPWPANSPDLNPIENAFALLKRDVQHAMCTDEATLRAAIIAAWDALPLQTTANLMNSIPRRLQECRRKEGGRTKY